ncbi:MAG: sugar ABC transporter ATP-binding protein [Fimbriimonas sp.]
MSAPVLSVRNLSKRFPGVHALDGVSVDIAAGSCHALMGENGAGKSTLGKILAGLYAPDEGEILLDGKPIHFGSPRDAAEAGVAIVHQELLFCENLSVAENLALADLPSKGLFVDRDAMRARAREWLAAVGAEIDPDALLGELSVSRQQLVQIAGGVGRGARVLIFDEPTSSLSRSEADRLLGLIRDLRDRGVTCIVVSHRLEEVFAVADAITVLRDGKLVGTRSAAEVTREALVRMMVGRELAADATPPPVGGDEEVLKVENLTRPGHFRNVSFALRKGEILGIGGLVGSGRTELLEALFGLAPDLTGDVWIHGEPRTVRGPVAAMANGLGLVPEDRKRHGLVLGMGGRENISLPTLDKVARAGWVDLKAERSLAQKFFDRMRVKSPSLDATSLGLSGGNQQKLVIAKWLAAASDVLLVDEPTRGVDVGAKAEIHALLRELAAEGRAVLLVSSDLPELLALSSRVLVMREGEMVGELPARASEEQAMGLMAGVHS